MPSAYIAIDLGAESGRVIAAVLSHGRAELHELHRFSHAPVWLTTGLHWDITGIWREIVDGLKKTADWAREQQVNLVSVGVDAWGVDWALLDGTGELVGLPHAYRDPRNLAAYERALVTLGADRVYQTTGIQLMPINSLFSLYAHHLASPRALAAADKFLFIPDLIHFWLSGRVAVEATIASTSQMVDCKTGDWARSLLESLELPTNFLGDIVPPGTRVGTIRTDLAALTSLPADLQVVTPAAHDTGSAVAAVPAISSPNWCYLSSGTWSLLGAEISAPCVSPEAQQAMYTNELGVGGTIRFLKNIAGLWLVQQCRRDLDRLRKTHTYKELVQLAADAKPFVTLLDPAHPSFQSPGDMLAKLAEFARATGQPEPREPGAAVRACLESLALSYREKLLTLERILGRKFDVIHIVGGGGRNTLLSQMTADATGRRVIVGPYEATALGNALVQAMALGDVKNLAEVRQIVANSTELVTFEPTNAKDWDAAYKRFTTLLS